MLTARLFGGTGADILPARPDGACAEGPQSLQASASWWFCRSLTGPRRAKNSRSKMIEAKIIDGRKTAKALGHASETRIRGFLIGICPRCKTDILQRVVAI